MNTQSSLYKELTNDELKQIIESNFNTTQISEIELLDGGMFNTTYKICFGEPTKKVVLRLGPINRHLLLDFEQSLMEAENYVYKCCESYNIPCSTVLVCDTTREIVDRDYMIISYIEGVALSNLKLPKEIKANLYCEIGKYMSKFHSITNKSFGRVSYIVEGKIFDTWYDYLYFEISDITSKIEKYDAFTKTELQQIKEVYQKNKQLLNEITLPILVHTDLWEGNILVSKTDDKYEVKAIIDADRAIFADVDFELASPWMINDDFLKGYNPNFDFEDFNSQKRVIRRKIYLILYNMIDIYVGYAEYNNTDNAESLKKTVLSIVNDLNNL